MVLRKFVDVVDICLRFEGVRVLGYVVDSICKGFEVFSSVVCLGNCRYVWTVRV